MPVASRPACAANGDTRYARREPEETVLYGVVQRELETFLARARSRERTVPRFVERELRAYLRCGILVHGFVRVRCDACGLDRAVAFSCKGRGFCPSCGGRRMADTAAHLVDRVLPEVPIRQWVLSLPVALRHRLAYDPGLTSALLGVFVRTVFTSLRRRARRQWNVARGQCGAVTFVQRFGDALNLNLHFHSLLLDGVYEASPYGRPRFHPLPPPDDAEVARVVCQVAARIARLLERRGLGPDADPTEADPLSEEEPLLAQLYGASVASRIATGRRAGRPVIRVGDCIEPDVVPELDGERCASARGGSLHANVAVPARDRRRLERLCRYVARPPVATERLSRLADGRLLYRLKHRWRDGTTHVVFEPGELVEELAALVPPPRFHLVRYHGVLGPCASQRSRVVPGREAPGGGATDAPEGTSLAAPGHEDEERVSHRSGPADVGVLGPRPGSEVMPSREPLPEADVVGRPGVGGVGAPEPQVPVTEPSLHPRRLAWADLLRRVFAIDVLECPRCGARTRLLAAIHPTRRDECHPRLPRPPGAHPTARGRAPGRGSARSLGDRLRGRGFLTGRGHTLTSRSPRPRSGPVRLPSGARSAAGRPCRRARARLCAAPA